MINLDEYPYLKKFGELRGLDDPELVAGVYMRELGLLNDDDKLHVVLALCEMIAERNVVLATVEGHASVQVAAIEVLNTPRSQRKIN